MTSKKSGALRKTDSSSSVEVTNHNEVLAVEGLEDLFAWASEMVGDEEAQPRSNGSKQQIRQQMLEYVQQAREEKALKLANDEASYLQKRVIALLQQLQEMTQENSLLKQALVAQCFTLQIMPELQRELERLKQIEFSQVVANAEKQELLGAISCMKKDRDYLDDLLTTNEREVQRLAVKLADTTLVLEQLQSRRWWHAFIPVRK